MPGWKQVNISERSCWKWRVGETYLLHEDPRSGNCYKIKLTAALLGIELAKKQYDIMRGETRTPDFLAQVNSNGRIPVLQIDSSVGARRFLPESNAACWYLASGSHLIPNDRFVQADMLRWMFFEQYSHEPNVATLRFWMQFVGEANLSSEHSGQIAAKRSAGASALALLDQHLSDHAFLCGDSVSLADLALFPYTHVADEGGFDLGVYPAINRWITRIMELPGFVPMS